MGDFRPASLFVSYSHKDKRIVYPLVDMNEDLQRAAWVDYRHTIPGSDWDEEHKSAIENSYRLVLLWSVNSAKSEAVEREWRWALECGTAVVPVLLDETPLPPEISGLHGVSLRDYVVSRKGGPSLGRFPPSEWMGLGSAQDFLVLVLGAPLLIAVGWLVLEGIGHEWIIVNILSWVCMPFFAWYAINSVLAVPFQIKRAKLRYRLSRIVIENLKEWGRENRLAQQHDS